MAEKKVEPPDFSTDTPSIKTNEIEMGPVVVIPIIFFVISFILSVITMYHSGGTVLFFMISVILASLFCFFYLYKSFKKSSGGDQWHVLISKAYSWNVTFTTIIVFIFYNIDFSLHVLMIYKIIEFLVLFIAFFLDFKFFNINFSQYLKNRNIFINYLILRIISFIIITGFIHFFLPSLVSFYCDQFSCFRIEIL